ncbi:unnamed protein product [Amoebophrya sp. A25]|nr:unnamed protein product [Amoebophrya sp. A25]|eukprot:GSA25T00011773001.1
MDASSRVAEGYYVSSYVEIHAALPDGRPAFDTITVESGQLPTLESMSRGSSKPREFEFGKRRNVLPRVTVTRVLREHVMAETLREIHTKTHRHDRFTGTLSENLRLTPHIGKPKSTLSGGAQRGQTIVPNRRSTLPGLEQQGREVQGGDESTEHKSQSSFRLHSVSPDSGSAWDLKERIQKADAQIHAAIEHFWANGTVKKANEEANGFATT